jgi:ABC-type multidrug transport system ATPase subunit
MILQAHGLGHRFDQGWLFRHVAIDIAPGDRLLIQGFNGSGKSTLLKCLAGLLLPREGQISIPARVGYSAIELSVYPSLTVSEHLQFAADLRGVPADQDKLLRLVQLQEAHSKLAHHLSTGMKARLKLALALQGEPLLLILDEPTAALDEDGRDLIDQVMTSFSGGIVYASNDPADRSWATHVLAL